MILLIDDDNDDCLILREILDDVACEERFICIQQPDEAIQFLNDENSLRPSCIFLDINLPKMNGFDVLKKLKSSEKHRKVPVIMMSTSSLKQDMIKAKELGAYSYLEKSSPFSELKLSIAKLLRAFDEGQSRDMKRTVL